MQERVILYILDKDIMLYILDQDILLYPGYTASRAGGANPEAGRGTTSGPGRAWSGTWMWSRWSVSWVLLAIKEILVLIV